MSNDRQYQRNNLRQYPNGKENNPNDLEDQYTKSNNDIYQYSHWRPQGMIYGYDQYGFYPQPIGPPYHNGGMASAFDDEQYFIPEVIKSRQSGKKKIKLEYISGRNKRNVTFSKRKKGIMKKAYELNILTGTEILLLVASESGHVYTFATPKLRPIINEHENLIQSCLNAQGPGDQEYFHPEEQERDDYQDNYQTTDDLDKNDESEEGSE
ncbi:Serum response factor [Nosema bombycis CQ1]|uniref:Serum response factor n=1 Tax=Nosema bombycis (strain CQ1 / CVCC 102059) TaxID=578461 RepID=R0MKX7_NOSB1|nr:Serum response factor [Nosema bombycis CQ1]|eukprot:EOB13438.1 Serum response factor [Nosema bombycis CQ1]